MSGSLIGIALISGLSGSPHCVGMCGPLMLAVPGRAKRILSATLLYHTGRIFMYSIFGGIVGAAGLTWYHPGLRDQVSIGSGVFMLLMVWIPVWMGKKPGDWFTLPNGMQRISRWIAKGYRSSWLLAGAANGMLPCGLVYTALSIAIPAGDPFTGMAVMAAFGLGTLPLTLILTLSGPALSLPFRKRMSRYLPWLLSLVALLLMMRGRLFESESAQNPVPIHCAPDSSSTK